MIFSVITTTLNSGSFIDETIQSVISQRGSFEIEYIIVDALSTDNTREIIEHYEEKVNNGMYEINCSKVVIKYICEEDLGMYCGLSKGLKIAKGDVISYINSDDFYLPNAFSTIQTVFRHYPVNWVTGVNTFYNEMGSIVGSNLPCYYNSKFIQKGVYGRLLPYIQQESVFWKSNLMLRSNINYEDFSKLKYAGDFYLWVLFSKKSNLSIVNAQLSGFRARRGQKSSDLRRYEREFLTLINNEGLTFKERLSLFYLKLCWRAPAHFKSISHKNIISLSNIDAILQIIEKQPK